MHTFLLSAENWYLICFGVGLVLSGLAFVGGFGHLQFGHLHLGHFHLGHARAGHLHTHAPPGGHDSSLSPLNGFTLLAFLCWFGGAGYLLRRFSSLWGMGVFALAVLSGLAGALHRLSLLEPVLLPR